MRRLLVSPEEKIDPGEGVYAIGCSNYEKRYKGETKRKFNTRVKEDREDVDKLMEPLLGRLERNLRLIDGHQPSVIDWQHARH